MREDEFKIMWAYFDKIKKEYNYIFHSKLAVKMCSPDYFKSAIVKGEGEIVQVEIRHHITTKGEVKENVY